jgi:hypothetical protein
MRVRAGLLATVVVIVCMGLGYLISGAAFVLFAMVVGLGTYTDATAGLPVPSFPGQSSA